MLAAGKGVIIAADELDARAALEVFFAEKRFGETEVVLEEFLDGEELSLLALCDGERAVPLAPAQDYKRSLDGDEGPNTGGMGSYSPVPGFDPEHAEELTRLAHQPIVDELRRRGTPYHGILYAGLMLTSAGPRVLEFNCRFGDPETQAVLPRLRSDLVDAARGRGHAGRARGGGAGVVRGLGGDGGARRRRLSRLVLEGRRDHRPATAPGRRGLPRGHGRGGRRDRDRGRSRAERDRARRRRGRRARDRAYAAAERISSTASRCGPT